MSETFDKSQMSESFDVPAGCTTATNMQTLRTSHLNIHTPAGPGSVT